MNNQRVIKFRVWNTILGTYESRGDCCNGPFISLDGTYVPVAKGSFYPVVIEQFTGLLDKNGKEIYEGDILSYANNEARVLIQYIPESARFGGLVVLQHNEEPENDAYVWFDDGETRRYTVIGTLHENPELLNPPVSS